MNEIEHVSTRFPDRFGIKDSMRKGVMQNQEFLDLTLKSYDLYIHLQRQKLSITESIKTSKDISVFDHQILAAQKIKNDMGGSAILADEVGLGKTVEAGILIKEFLVTGLAKKILILTPPSLLSQWKDEMLSKFNLDFLICGHDLRDVDLDLHDLFLMSHSSAVFPKQSDMLNSVFWDIVVVDEAHSMKNSMTAKHRLVRHLSKRNILLLTATPLQNNLEELYNLIDLVRPGHLGTWKQFRNRYVTDHASRTINVAFRDEIQRILSGIVIRTTRQEVRKYIKFTDRIPHTRILKPSSQEADLYDGITKIVRGQYLSGTDTFVLMIYQKLASSSIEASKKALYKLKSNKMISDDKYDELMYVANRAFSVDSKMSALLNAMNNTSSKFLIFTEFYATQDYVAEELSKNGYSVTLFNGKMNTDERLDSIKQFKEDTNVMISTSAGGEGQNFQFCHNVVNYDLPWNPMKIEQRIGRVHRIGQQHDVHIFNFALEGTIESYILELLYTKINLFKMTLGDMDLIFEDSWGGGSPYSWFKQYMDAETEQERKNQFSALGIDWSNRKKNVSNTVLDFNTSVFKNFDLSTIGKSP